MPTIIRRRGLGHKSVNGIIESSENEMRWFRPADQQHIPDDVYIRWGCTAELPRGGDHRTINESRGIHKVNDKSGFRHVMQEQELCPETWWDIQYVPDDRYPVIVRSRTHAQGRKMWVCRDRDDLIQAAGRAGPGYYVNEFIDKVQEFRVFVMQGRVVWVAEKTPGRGNGIAWNVAKGGRFDNVRWDNWNMNVVNNALKVWELTDLHFSGIDVMLDREGKAWCVEANSAPSQTSPYRQGCVAKAIDWMMDSEEFDRRAFDPVEAEKYRDAIHPGVLGGH